ncbi:hypothetical protein [Aquiflexum lacus]|uniref:hypothetical protein n=1 Tax=Aquiflexum lacus TaxID=2483805 RepID=UPI001895FED1|nr:hypothetical protein [Aquiflexum lacus]
MKKVIIAIIFAVGVSLSATANTLSSEELEKTAVSLKKVDQNKVQLFYGLNEESTVLVKIYDENHYLVQKDRTVSKNAFAKYYDFSQLNPGVYTMELYSDNELLDKIEMDMRQTEVKPIVYSKLEKVEFNTFKLLVNSIFASDMILEVYENDRLIHEEKFENVSGFHKLYKIEGVSPTSRLEFFVRTSDGFKNVLAAR